MIFILHQTLQLYKLEGVNFKCDTNFSVQKYPNKALFVVNVSSLFKGTTDFEMAIVSFTFQPKILKYEIFFENSRIFLVKCNFE